MPKPTAFDMERALAYRLGVKLVTDIAMQRQDIDLILQDGATVSVKKQDAAARSGNISLEVEQIDTRTGASIPGNFSACKAKYIIIVVPGQAPGDYEAHIWEHATLAKLVAQGSYRKAHLTQERLDANRRRGNRYDDAVSILVPLAVARKYSRGVHRFNYNLLQGEREYHAFCAMHPTNQREY